MGIYHRGMGKKTKIINDMEFAFTNFYGKPPSWFDPECNRYNMFMNRSEKNATIHKENIKFVVMGNKMFDGVPVAKWNGAYIMDDYYWDNNIIGSFIVVNNEYFFKPKGL